MTTITLYWNNICILHRQELQFLNEIREELRKDNIDLDITCFGLGYGRHMSDYLREEAGIPENAKLCAYVDEDENTVTIAEAGYDHDLRDVPPYLLEMLAASGICIGELEERLMLEDTVYGA